MDRRSLLRILSAAAGAAGIPVDVLAELSARGARRVPLRAWFTPQQRAALSGMVDAIIPRTDTPGAVEAGVVDFLEVVVSERMDAADRVRFMRGLADAMTRSDVGGADPTGGGTNASWTSVLTQLAREGDAARQAGPDAPERFFHTLRSLTLHGYYTSEIGMMEELLYRPLPGRYEGCVDVAEVTRASSGGA